MPTTTPTTPTTQVLPNIPSASMPTEATPGSQTAIQNQVEQLMQDMLALKNQLQEVVKENQDLKNKFIQPRGDLPEQQIKEIDEQKKLEEKVNELVAERDLLKTKSEKENKDFLFNNSLFQVDDKISKTQYNIVGTDVPLKVISFEGSEEVFTNFIEANILNPQKINEHTSESTPPTPSESTLFTQSSLPSARNSIQSKGWSNLSHAEKEQKIKNLAVLVIVSGTLYIVFKKREQIINCGKFVVTKSIETLLPIMKDSIINIKDLIIKIFQYLP